jgi:hypothetical protein
MPEWATKIQQRWSEQASELLAALPETIPDPDNDDWMSAEDVPVTDEMRSALNALIDQALAISDLRILSNNTADLGVILTNLVRVDQYVRLNKIQADTLAQFNRDSIRVAAPLIENFGL